MPDMPAASSRVRTAEILTALAALSLIAFPFFADQRWFDRHFLPSFFFTRDEYVRIELIVRATAAIIGLSLLLLARRHVARTLADHPDVILTTALAVVLAFGATEIILRQKRMRAAEEVPPKKEPLRNLDGRLGWLFVPSHTGYQSNNGRRVQYVMDANGYRVRTPEDRVDFNAPAILFAGESMMVGEKLLWRETIPALVGSRLGIQPVNIAVSGYATDQAYLRLASELPRFRNPVAVVMLFSPSIFDRNLDDDRPHLDEHLALKPPADHWRLLALARRIVRYRSDETIERGVATTRELLRATVRLARSRGAVALIVVPQFTPETPRERDLRRRILDAAKLPYVLVPLDPNARVPDDGHPNAAATAVVADAVASRLYDALSLGTRYASRSLYEQNPTVRSRGDALGLQSHAGSSSSTPDGVD